MTLNKSYHICITSRIFLYMLAVVVTRSSSDVMYEHRVPSLLYQT